ncbi:MAG: superoxide dismutase [Gemmataceae bacterium]
MQSLTTRRQWLRTVAVGAAALAVAPKTARAADAFTLPPLPYPADALEPSIDKETMTIHHDRHHKAYVDNLNAAVAKAPSLAGKSIDDILRDLSKVPADVKAAVTNNGGGHYNHTLFWSTMGPKAGGEPTGKLGDAIKSTFGDFAKFKAEMKTAGLTQFGSGWAWLVAADGKLKVMKTANQDTPLSLGAKPLVGVDVWEHAYYLKYQNKRADYIDAWWAVVNWKAVGDRFAMV